MERCVSNRENSCTILLVEDEALIALDEKTKLEKHGFHVLTAHTAEKAIAAVRDQDIDLILMDIDLGKGKMDGTEAAEIILKDQELPIVFLTSHTEKEMVDRVKGITRYGYVLKSAGEFVLVEAISMAFELFEAYHREQQSRKQLSTIFNQAAVGIGQFRLDGSFIDMNEKYSLITGYSKDELLEMNIFTITHPEDRQAQEPTVQKMLSGESDSFSLEKRYIHKSGKTIWVQLESNMVRDNKGNPLYTIAVAIDITARKAYEQSVQDGKNNAQRIVQKLPVPVLLSTGKSEKVLSVNEKFMELFGYTKEDIPDVSHWWELAYPDPEYRRQVSSRWEELLRRAAETGKEIEPVEAYIHCKDGRVRYVSVRAFSLDELHMVVFMDLSHLK
ncbi:MAG: PAS domain S-box protein [Spirochaetales bacterium]|nr:PAS domain S-box protein [Spirochaetales bacterium]MCF7938688.1 PAS domain S-box protein [Spirochaetales bacterium]